MSSKNDATKLGVLGVASLGSLYGFGAGEAQAADDEVQKQAARLISQAISSRVGQTVSLRGVLDDAHANGMWGSAGYVPIDVAAGSIDTGLGIFGVDFGGSGSVLFGVVGNASTSSATFEAPGATTEFTSTSAGVGPYAALIVNDNFFFSGLLTYSSTYTETFIDTAFLDLYNTSTNGALNAEISANLQVKFGSVVARGKATVSSATFIPEEGDSTTNYSAGFGAEAENMFTDHLGGYITAQTSYPLDSEAADQSTSVSVGVGAFVKFDERRQIGLQYGTVTGLQDVEVSSIMLTGRMRF